MVLAMGPTLCPDPSKRESFARAPRSCPSFVGFSIATPAAASHHEHGSRRQLKEEEKEIKRQICRSLNF